MLKNKKQKGLSEKKLIFEKKEVLRNIYQSWYQRIKKNLKGVGKTLEVGSGCDDFKKFCPDSISSDIIKSDWIDVRLDAQLLPFKDHSIANIVGIDVLHHLGAPEIFFSEAGRVLRPGGRIVLVEIYISAVSSIVLKLLHFEDFSMNAFASKIFYRYPKKYRHLFKDFRVINKCVHDFLIYPLSGGFNYPSMVPVRLQFLFKRLEGSFDFLRYVGAFKTTIILEKKN